MKRAFHLGLVTFISLGVRSQCMVSSVVTIGTVNCSGYDVVVTFTGGGSMTNYAYSISTDDGVYNSGSTGPSGFTYHVPWTTDPVISNINVTAFDDFSLCQALGAWTGTLTRLETLVEYSTDLNCTTGKWTLRWTNADDACGNAGSHLIRVGGYNGQVSNFCTQESPSVWRFNTPLDPPGTQFGIDYVIGGPASGYQCGGGTVQCFAPINQSITLPYVQPGDCGVNFNLKAALQGPLATNGTMGEGLRTANLVPLTEPYSALGYSYNGNPSLSPIPAYYLTTAPWAIVDWLVVELRSAQNPATVVYSKPVLIKKDGRVHDKNFYDQVSGTLDENLNFPVAAGNYYVALRHRNHLAIMTAMAIALDDEPEMLDLRSAAIGSYGTNARVNVNGVMALWAGDATGNGAVKYTGANNDRDPLLVAVGSTTPNNALTGQYSRLDANMDGAVKYTGTSNDRDVILPNVGSTTPNNTRTQQLP